MFNDSLGVLVARYGHVTPSFARLPQFRGDVTAVLLVASEVLTMISGSLDRVFAATAMDDTYSIGESIHAKCSHLLAVLATVTSPYDCLVEAVDAAAKRAKKRERKRSSSAATLTLNEARTAWMHLVRARLFGGKSDGVGPAAHVGLLAKLVAHQPEPSWPMTVQLLMCKNMAAAKAILMHFGAFKPAAGGDNEAKSGSGCGGMQCGGDCYGAPARLLWPHAVGSGVVRICAHASGGGQQVLAQLYEPLLQKLSKTSWDCMDKGGLRYTKKPVWFQALVTMAEPSLVPVVQDLVDMVSSGKAWTLKQVGEAMREVLADLADVAPSLPPALLHMFPHLDSRLPMGVSPLCQSSAIQICVSGLHGLVTRLLPVAKERKLARERLDFLSAFGNALCNLDEAELRNVQSAIEAARQESVDEGEALRRPDRSFDHVTNEYAFSVSQLVSDGLLSDQYGRWALRSVYRFVCYNADWLHSCVEVAEGGGGGGVATATSVDSPSIPFLIKPWGSEIFPPQSPYEMLHQIGSFMCADNSFESGGGHHGGGQTQIMNGGGGTSLPLAKADSVADKGVGIGCYQFARNCISS